jgi:hypothetical protein
MALLELPKEGRLSLPLEDLHPAEEHRIVVIGYSAKDSSRNPFFSQSIFGGNFGYKRGALGEILDGGGTPIFYHDCSTLGGNSGSPVFSLATGKVIGIHSGGFFMYRNQALDGLALTKFAVI